MTPIWPGAGSRISALLASALDTPPYEPITSALVSGLKDEPALDVLAGWLASRIDGPVQRAVGDLKGRAGPAHPDHHAEPAAGRRDGDDEPHRSTGCAAALPRRETRECLAEDMRRLDADEIYREALAGIEKVQYV